MRVKFLGRLTAILVSLCLLTGCAVQEPNPTEPESLPDVTEPAVDTRSWAERTVQAYAEYSGLSYDVYPENMLVLLEKNPEAIGFVLRYPEEYGKTHEIDMSEFAGSEDVPLFIQWDQRWGYIPYGADVAGITACGPLCLSMVAYHLTGDENMRPDKMIQFAIDEGYCVPGNGSAWTLISKGAQKLGLNVKQLPLVEGRIRSELEAGHPVICIMGPGVFTTTGHFIVLTGYEDGKFRVNDPNSVIRSSQLWDYNEFQSQIRNLWALSAP